MRVCSFIALRDYYYLANQQNIFHHKEIGNVRKKKTISKV